MQKNIKLKTTNLLLVSVFQYEAEFVPILYLNVQIVGKIGKSLLHLEVRLGLKVRPKLGIKMSKNFKPKTSRYSPEAR